MYLHQKHRLFSQQKIDCWQQEEKKVIGRELAFSWDSRLWFAISKRIDQVGSGGIEK